jgi:multisubunit Na+/H+ antiporter MnhC subunit
MYAYHIPVSLQNIFLIVAASSISSTIAIAPGAVGSQTALISVVLKGVAPQSTITAYTVGQALITTAWSVGFGLTMLATQIGWKQTRGLIHVKKKKDGEDDPLADGPLADAPVADTGSPDATG